MAKKPMSQETKDKIAAARRGKKMSDETKAKVSQRTKEAMDNPEVKEKVGSAMRGKHHTEETKQKQSKHATENSDKYHSLNQRLASKKFLDGKWAGKKNRD